MKFILLALFFAIPIAEIAIFIEVGNLVGLWPTLGLILLTAFAGIVLIRIQGLSTIEKARRLIERDELPVEPMIHGVGLIIAGALLVTPGFFTDIIGFALLIPPLRLEIARRVLRMMRRSGRFSGTVHTRERDDSRGIIIDIEGAPTHDKRPGPAIEGEVVNETSTSARERRDNTARHRRNP